MIGLDFVLIAVAGGLGAGGRYLVDAFIMRGRSEAFPLGILVVNVVGAFLLGLLTATAIGPTWLLILGVGLLGGFTTFSTVSVETVLLARRGRRDWAWGNLLITAGAAIVAAALGIALGGLFPG